MQLGNALTLVGLVLSLSTRPFLTEDPSGAWINLAALAMFALAYILNAVGHPLATALIIALIGPLVMVVQLQFGEIKSGGHFYLIPGALLPFLIFPASATRLAIASSLITSVVFIVITLYEQGQVELLAILDTGGLQAQLHQVAVPAVMCLLGYYTWRLLCIGEEGIAAEQQRTHELLLNLFPQSIVHRLQRRERICARRHGDASVLFCRVIGFDPWSSDALETQLRALGVVFETFDDICAHHGVEKIKSFGNSYMAVSGLPEPRSDHAEALASTALDLLDAAARLQIEQGWSIELRIGIHSGPVVAGIIGKRRATYDLWGDVVNMAQRMEAHGMTGAVQVSSITFAKINHQFNCEVRPPIAFKGKLPERAYLLRGMTRSRKIGT